MRHSAGRHASRAAFCVADAQLLPVIDDVFDAVVSGLVLNFIPDRTRALTEMRRAARRGGTVAVYVWDYAGQMELTSLFWNAAVTLDPAALALHEGQRFGDCRRELLRSLFEDVQLALIDHTALVVSKTFADFGDYWSRFLGGQGPAPAYAISLSEANRSLLRDELRRTVPTAPDGTVHLTARAWAVRGVKG